MINNNKTNLKAHTLKYVLTILVIAVILSACNSSTSNNDDCENSVTVERIRSTSAVINFSHSCMSCEIWKVKYSKTCFFCWTVHVETFNTQGNAFQGNSIVLGGLSPNSNYKARVFSVGSPVSGQPCVQQKIGEVTFSTN